MREIFIIWKKEILDSIRDKRTLLSMLLMPMLLMPLIIVGVGKFVEYQTKKSEEQIVKIAVVGENNGKDLVEFIKKQDKIEIIQIDGNIEDAVKDKNVDLGVIIPPNFQDLLEKGKGMNIEILKNSLNDRSSTALARVGTAVNTFNGALLQSRLTEKNLGTEILSTVSFSLKEVATEKELGGFGLGFLLPMFIVIWAIAGGQYTAIDVSAGEKERKTLEALFLTPVKRIKIVLGKFLAVSTAAFLSVVISISSIYISMRTFNVTPGQESTVSASPSNGTVSASQDIGFDMSLDIKTLPILILVSILLVITFSSILLSIGIFAKSYKEAESYMTPAYLLVVLPVVLINTIPGFKPPISFFALPAINASLLFKEVLIGVYDAGHIAVTLVSLIICSIISLYIANRIYLKENVLFRE
jgi:sodium transport system permease protein